MTIVHRDAPGEREATRIATPGQAPTGSPDRCHPSTIGEDGNVRRLAGVAGGMDPSKWQGRATVSIVALLIACSAPTEERASPSARPSPGPIVAGGAASCSAETTARSTLWLSDGRDRIVTSFRGPQFDPDGYGRLLVFRDSRAGVNVNDDIAVIRADGTGYRNLTERRMATSGDRSGPRTADGSPTRPTRTAAAALHDGRGRPEHPQALGRLGRDPAWSPDGPGSRSRPRWEVRRCSAIPTTTCS